MAETVAKRTAKKIAVEKGGGVGQKMRKTQKAGLVTTPVSTWNPRLLTPIRGCNPRSMKSLVG